MKYSISKSVIILFFLTSWIGIATAQVPIEADFETPYGSNESVGKYADVNGIKMYYEEYGEGEPMFLIHGNGADIKSMGHQIEYFKNSYRVIIADSRGHGKSELNSDSLTYVEMAADWAALADYLKLDSLYLIGWSDGGIISLLMGIHHPEKVKKLATMGANLRPDTTAIYPYAANWVKQMRPVVDASIKHGDKSENWAILKQHLGLLGDQPTISKSDLSKISAPALIIAGDQDIIREEHTVEIFQNIPNAHLCILPGETHYSPAMNSTLFNSIVDNFMSKPFSRPNSDWTKED